MTPYLPPASCSCSRQTEYLSPAYYTSMGFAVPAALGAMVARPKLRPIVLVGDGAFQMTGMELSSIVRNGFCPVVIVLDNEGYGTERMLLPGDHPFNDVRPWHYSKLPEVLGAGKGYEVRTRGRLRPSPRCGPGRPAADAPSPRPSRPERLQPDARAIDDETSHAGMRAIRSHFSPHRENRRQRVRWGRHSCLP